MPLTPNDIAFHGGRAGSPREHIMEHAGGRMPGGSQGSYAETVWLICFPQYPRNISKLATTNGQINKYLIKAGNKSETYFNTTPKNTDVLFRCMGRGEYKPSPGAWEIYALGQRSRELTIETQSIRLLSRSTL